MLADGLADHVANGIEVAVADWACQSAASAEIAGHRDAGKGRHALSGIGRSHTVDTDSRQIHAAARDTGERKPSLICGRRAEGVNVAQVRHLLATERLIDRVGNIATAVPVQRYLQRKVADSDVIFCS